MCCIRRDYIELKRLDPVCVAFVYSQARVTVDSITRGGQQPPDVNAKVLANHINDCYVHNDAQEAVYIPLATVQSVLTHLTDPGHTRDGRGLLGGLFLDTVETMFRQRKLIAALEDQVAAMSDESGALSARLLRLRELDKVHAVQIDRITGCINKLNA